MQLPSLVYPLESSWLHHLGGCFQVGVLCFCFNICNYKKWLRFCLCLKIKHPVWRFSGCPAFHSLLSSQPRGYVFLASLWYWMRKCQEVFFPFVLIFLKNPISFSFFFFFSQGLLRSTKSLINRKNKRLWSSRKEGLTQSSKKTCSILLI